MALTTFQALDKAIAAGGTGLSGRTIASGKGAAAVLKDLCASGLLVQSGRQFTITPQGRALWEREAPPERLRLLQAQEQQRQRQQLTDFLRVVEKKSGKKAMTRPEQARFAESLRQKACEQKLVQPGPKPNTYLLLPAGETMLLAEQPPERQVEYLREKHRETVKHWRAAEQRLQEEVQHLEAHGGQPLIAASKDLDERAKQAIGALEKVISELSAFTGLLAAAKQFGEIVEAQAAAKLEQVHSEVARLSELEQRVRHAAADQRTNLDEFERRMSERLQELERHSIAGVGKVNQVSPRDPGHPPPAESTTWDETRHAYQRLQQETLRLGGIVKVPDLTDAVRKVLPGLAAPAFHDLLRKWQQDDRLTLQLCNDRRLEPRAAEGIESPHGLLFYIQMR